MCYIVYTYVYTIIDMQIYSVRQVREQLRHALDSAELGEEVRIKRGNRYFRLSVERNEADTTLPSRAKLRSTMKTSEQSSAQLLAEERER